MASTRLVLVRHAKPQPPGPGPDLARELSPAGWQQARSLGQRLKTTDAPGLILTSPATRCMQTAEAILQALPEPAPPLRVEASLGLDDASGLAAFLPGAARCVLVVSHQPTLLALGAVLLGARGPALDLRPAQAAVLAHDASGWSFVAWLDPPSP